MASSFDIRDLLGLNALSPYLQQRISALAAQISAADAATPEVKSYPDAVYFNYFRLGLSLLFKPINGYKPTAGLKVESLNRDDLVLDGVDVYNLPKLKAGSPAPSKSTPAYSTFPITPLILTLSPEDAGPDQKPRLEKFEVSLTTTGKEFVECLGEPDRKGGGAGPSSGSIGIWCEWSKDGLMVEFGGDESRGPQAWERGKDAIWKVITIFPPNKS